MISLYAGIGAFWQALKDAFVVDLPIGGHRV